MKQTNQTALILGTMIIVAAILGLAAEPFPTEAELSPFEKARRAAVQEGLATGETPDNLLIRDPIPTTDDDRKRYGFDPDQKYGGDPDDIMIWWVGDTYMTVTERDGKKREPVEFLTIGGE